MMIRNPPRSLPPGGSIAVASALPSLSRNVRKSGISRCTWASRPMSRSIALGPERTATGEYTAPTSELSVTTPLGLGRTILIPIIADFLKAYPEIKVRIIPTDRVLSLFQEQVDVGLRIGTLPDSSLIAIPLGTTRRVLCASPAYLATHVTPRTPEDLVGHDCINYTGFASGDIWTFVRDKVAVAVPVHTRLVVGSVEAACAAARASIGITIAFAYQLQADPAAGALTTLLGDFQPSPRPVNLELLHFGNAENEGDSILRPSAFGSGQEDRNERS
jgi:DNA-binding transcriptional LysR family regulator